MKICFLVSHLNSGGAERTVVYLAQYFAEAKNEVFILSLSNQSFYDISKNVKYVSLCINSRNTCFVSRIANAIRRLLGVRKFISDCRPDVIVCLIPEMMKYIKISKSTKIITSERNFPAICKTSRLRAKMFKKSDGIVFQTERAKKWYPEEIQKKGVVIHNAVGNELVYQAPAVVKRKKKISAVGRLSNQKDYPTLFRAFKIILDTHPDYVLEIFGEGPDRAKLMDDVNELGISNSINFMGTHKDAILQIADSSCYVMSSKYEGMPNALMEAMAVGLPCVSTDCPNGPAELIESGENGLLVPVGDSEALAKAILMMIEDINFAEACGTEAKKILNTHSVDIIAEQYLNYIESVVAQGKTK